MKIDNFLITFLSSIVFSMVASISPAQSYQDETIREKPDFQWPEGKKMALSLTFDDARLSQVDKGIPLLDKYGVKATFYLSPDNMKQRLAGWKKAIADGHDIGNHTLYHPCSGNFAWSRDHALENYTLEDMSRELDSASYIIKKTLGFQPVSFAYPCGQTFIGRGSMTRSLIMEAKNKGLWLIFAGHEMNEGGAQTSLLTTIEAICKYASDPVNGIWIDNVHNIAAYVKEKREKP
jgi:hypothetical protein